jgi:hypothetical protein
MPALCAGSLGGICGNGAGSQKEPKKPYAYNRAAYPAGTAGKNTNRASGQRLHDNRPRLLSLAGKNKVTLPYQARHEKPRRTPENSGAKNRRGTFLNG